jgi:hypothetical protein
MSWDVVIFNLNKKIDSVEDINEDVLVDIGSGADFKKMLNNYFGNVIWDGNWGKIEKENYALEFSLADDDESFSNMIFHLYGEKAIYALIDFCRKNNWQAFDTGLGEMLDLDRPERNGYEKFQEYLSFVLKNRG